MLKLPFAFNGRRERERLVSESKRFQFERPARPKPRLYVITTSLGYGYALCFNLVPLTEISNDNGSPIHTLTHCAHTCAHVYV